MGLFPIVPDAQIDQKRDLEIRRREGLEPTTGPLHGEEPPAHIEIVEGPCRLAVDPRQGHKTGFYLDQRENRVLFGQYASGKEVLNAFAYTGAFGLQAQAGGATRVTHVESSPAALVR